MREYYVGANTAVSYFLGRTMSSFPNSLMFLLTVRFFVVFLWCGVHGGGACQWPGACVVLRFCALWCAWGRWAPVAGRVVQYVVLAHVTYTLTSHTPQGVIPYFMTGLAPEGFGKFLLIFLLMNHSAQSMGYLASSFSANPIVGMSILPLLITPMILFSGMLYERNSVPAGLEWLQDISLVNYGYALMVINQAQYVL